jgi:hypothetical protein
LARDPADFFVDVWLLEEDLMRIRIVPPSGCSM